jgi:LysM repeat protein
MTPTALMKLNGLKRELIFAGQSLVVSGKASAKSPKSKATRAIKSSKSKTAAPPPASR